MDKPDQNSNDSTKRDRNNIFDVKHLQADIKGHSIRGGAYTLIAQAARFFLMLGGTIALARLLTPKDFGLLAMVTSVTAFAFVFRDLGLSTATIQKSEINHGQISILFWINSCIGFITMLVVASMAPAISHFYDESRLTSITLILSTTFFMGGLTIQHQALLRRQMRFGVLALIQILAVSLSTVIAIVLALCGTGYWALVAMQPINVGVTMLGMFVACPWRPGLPVRRSGVRSMLLFGGHITGFSIVNYFSRNLDKVLIGRLCGEELLGFYSKAHEMLNMPISNLRSPLNAVAIPALSRLQDDPERYRRFYSQLLLVLAFFSMPLLVFLCVCSESVILLVLGDQWTGMNQIFKILAVACFLQPVAGTRGLIMVSCGQTARYLKWGIIASILTISAIAIGTYWGVIGVATMLAITWNIIVIPSLSYCFQQTPATTSTFVKAIWRSIVASLTMGVALFYSSKYIVMQNAFFQTLVSFLIGAAVFLLVWIAIPGGFGELKRIYGFTAYLIPKKKKPA